MSEMLAEYVLFLAKVSTFLVAALVFAALLGWGQRRGTDADGLRVTHLNRKYAGMAQRLKREILPRRAWLRAVRAERARAKATRRRGPARKRMFVLNFRGDLMATAVTSLREEVTAVLSVAEPQDEVVVRLTNAGGLVHEHGLAASQLMRIKQMKIPLTVAVDKVAASGGYLMACVADRILAAPFAIVGSIGVLAQLPNFYRLLERHGVHFELIKAGELKRTLTMFGPNTDADRAKVKEQLEDTHRLFKEVIAAHRPAVDLATVATGEYWHASRALELKLVDAITTSDDYLLKSSETADLYEVVYALRKPLRQRLAAVVQQSIVRLAGRVWPARDVWPS